MYKAFACALVTWAATMLACASTSTTVTPIPKLPPSPIAADKATPIKPSTVVPAANTPTPTPDFTPVKPPTEMPEGPSPTPTGIKPPPASPSAVKPPTVEPSASPSRNDIGNLRPVDVSATELKITADYVYNGDQGTKNIFMAAYALMGNTGVPGTGYVPGAIKVGSGGVTVSIKMVAGSGTYTSDTIRMCLYVGGGNQFYCENQAYKKTWKR